MKQDYYKLLGVGRNATQEEIKEAFRTMIKKYHPDVNPAPNANEISAQIIEAYNVLSDIKTRMKYDNDYVSTSKQASNQHNSYQKQQDEQQRKQAYQKWREEQKQREYNEAKTAYDYYHYSKSREESESDFEDWIKEYLKKQRDIKKYNYKKIIDNNINDNYILNYNNNNIKIINNKPRYDKREIYSDDETLESILSLLKGKKIDLSQLSKIIQNNTKEHKEIVQQQQIAIPNNDKLSQFIIVYNKLAKELVYDREYVKKVDSIANYFRHNFQDKLKENIRRTSQDKKGVCTTFAMRLHYELTQLGIENYLMRILKPTTIHWVNLYFIDENIFIADITDDIVQDHYEYPSEKYRRKTPISSMISFGEFFKKTDPSLCSIVNSENDSFDNDIKLQEFLLSRLNQKTENKKR